MPKKRDPLEVVAPNPMMGRVVGFVLDRGPYQGEMRPGMITRVNEDGTTLNLYIFADQVAGGDNCGPSQAPVRRKVPYGNSPLADGSPREDKRGCWLPLPEAPKAEG